MLPEEQEEKEKKKRQLKWFYTIFDKLESQFLDKIYKEDFIAFKEAIG